MIAPVKNHQIYISLTLSDAASNLSVCDRLKKVVYIQTYTTKGLKVQDFFLKNFEGDAESWSKCGISLLRNVPDLPESWLSDPLRERESVCVCVWRRVCVFE